MLGEVITVSHPPDTWSRMLMSQASRHYSYRTTDKRQHIRLQYGGEGGYAWKMNTSPEPDFLTIDEICVLLDIVVG